VKRTIWRPLFLGVALGLLAGVSTITGLSFLVPGTDTESAVGFFMTLFLLAAALGGPMAGAIAPVLWAATAALFGPPEMKEILSEPVVFWSNTIVLGMLMVMVGIGYRLIFERVRMPIRLIPCAGFVIAVYFINPLLLIPAQYYLLGGVDALPAIIFSYKTYFPQEVFDIFFTSLVFVALPASFIRPLWVEAQPTPLCDNGA
jgi:hypothetical protein